MKCLKRLTFCLVSFALIAGIFALAPLAAKADSVLASDTFSSIGSEWSTDRYAPDGFDSESFDGNRRLEISIGPDNAVEQRTDKSYFRDTQGRQRTLDKKGVYPWKASAELYISADMLGGSTLRRTDMWIGTKENATNNVTHWAIVGMKRGPASALENTAEGRDPTAGDIETKWRYWDSVTDTWTESGKAVTGGWHMLSIVGGEQEIRYLIDGEDIGGYSLGVDSYPGIVYMQAYNFGLAGEGLDDVVWTNGSKNYRVYWDNFKLEDVSPANILVDCGFDQDDGELIPLAGGKWAQKGYNAFSTIQAAIDAAEEDDTVFVNAGTYNEEVRLKKGIKLYGPNHNKNPNVSGEWDESNKAILTGGIIRDSETHDLDGVEIKGLDIHDKGIKIEGWIGSTYLGLKDFIISNNRFDNIDVPQYAAIHFNLAPAERVENLEITNNRITNVIGLDASGMNISDCKGTVNVNDNYVEGVRHSCIQFTSSATGTLNVNGNILKDWDTDSLNGGRALRFNGLAATITAHQNVMKKTGPVNDIIKISSCGPMDATHNYWNSAEPDFTTALIGSAEYFPWYKDEGLTDLTEMDEDIWVDDSFTAADGAYFALANGKYVKMGENAFITVEAAVQKAAADTDTDDDTIRVLAGTYTPPRMAIAENVEIIGVPDGAVKPVLTGNATNSKLFSLSVAGVELKLNNLEMRLGANGQSLMDLSRGKMVIENCAFNKATGVDYGYNLITGGGLSAATVEFKNNVVNIPFRAAITAIGNDSVITDNEFNINSETYPGDITKRTSVLSLIADEHTGDITVTGNTFRGANRVLAVDNAEDMPANKLIFNQNKFIDTRYAFELSTAENLDDGTYDISRNYYIFGALVTSPRVQDAESAGDALGGFTAAYNTAASNSVVTVAPFYLDEAMATLSVLDNDIWVDDGFTAMNGDYFALPSGKYVQMGRNAFTAMPAAVKKAENGDTISVLPGTYVLDPDTTWSAGGQTGWYLPIVQNGLTLQGVNDAGVPIAAKPGLTTDLPLIYGTFTANGAWASQSLIAVFGDDVTITGLALMPKSRPNKTIEVIGANPTVKYCRFTPTSLDVHALDGYDWTNYGGSLYINGGTLASSDVLIEDNYFFKSNVSFDSADFAGGVTVKGNTFDTPCTRVSTSTGAITTLSMIGNTTWASPAVTDTCDVNIEGNRFIGLPSGYNFAVRNRMNGEFIMKANFMEGDDVSRVDYDYLQYGCFDGSIYVDTMEDDSGNIVDVKKRIGAPALYDGVAVNTEWAGTTAGTVVYFGDYRAVFGTNACATINEGIAKAAAGKTVLVLPGEYSESVNVNKEITLKGSGADTTFIRHTTRPNNGVVIGADNVTLSDFTISGYNYAINISNVEDVTLKNITATGNGSGVKISSQTSVDGLTIDGCKFNDNSASGLYADTNSTVKPVVTDVLVKNSEFKGNTQKAFYIEKLEHALFQNVEFVGEMDINLKYQEYNDITFENCSVTATGVEYQAGRGGNGLLIKGRNDGSYATPAGSLEGLTIKGGTFSSVDGFSAIQIGNDVTNISFEKNGSENVQIAGDGDGIVFYTDADVPQINSITFANTIDTFITAGACDVDATGAGLDFGGLTDPAAIEAKMIHKPDLAGLGLITWDTAAQSNTNLSGIAVATGTLTPAFSAAGTSYNVYLGAASGSTTLTANAGSALSMVSSDTTPGTIGTADKTVTLANGANEDVVFTVTAQNGATKQYTVHVSRDPILSANFLLETADVNNTAKTTAITGFGLADTKPAGTNYSLEAGYLYAISGKATNALNHPFSGARTSTITVTSPAAPSAENFRVFHWAERGTDGASDGLWIPAELHWVTAGNEHTLTITHALNYGYPMDAGAITDGPFAFKIDIPCTVNVSSIVRNSSSDALSNVLSQNIVITPNTNKDLAGLTPSAGTLTPDFSAGTTTYTLTLDKLTASTTITATGTEFATVGVDGAIGTGKAAAKTLSLANDESRTVVFTVAAQSGTLKNYTVNVVREKDDNFNLISLSASAGSLSPDFDADETAYTLTLDKGTASTKLTAVCSATATVGVDGAAGTGIVATKNVTLINGGTQKVIFTVTAQDGSARKYTVNVKRAKDDNANLVSLAVTAGTLSPDFDAGKTTYNLTLDKNTSATTITATGSTYAIVGVDDAAGSSKVAAKKVTLENGKTQTVKFTVTAQDGTTKDYTVNVSRNKDDNANLTGLTVSAGTLSPAFGADKTLYDLTLNTATSATTITATGGAYATVGVDGAAGTGKVAAKTVTLINGAKQTVTFTVKAQSGVTKNYTVVVRRMDLGKFKITCTNMVGKVIPDVKLGVYTDAAATVLFKSGTTDSAGQTTITGLEAKTYYIKVQAMPTGYKIPTNITALTAELDKTVGLTLLFDTEVLAYKNWHLKSIAVSAGKLSPAFDPDKLNYKLKLDEKTSNVKITPTKADSSSKLYINGKSANSITVSLKKGQSKTVSIRVKPKSGSSKYYKITVSRAKSTNANIKKLTVSKGKLTPPFTKANRAYTLALTKSQSSVRLSLSLESTYSSYKLYVDGKRTSSRTISLDKGKTKTVRIVVTAQDKSVSKTYTIVITRAK